MEERLMIKLQVLGLEDETMGKRLFLSLQLERQRGNRNK
jgi:hypothetical protein